MLDCRHGHSPDAGGLVGRFRRVRWVRDRCAGTPLPTEVNRITVTFNGIQAPILYASQKQINIQVPGALQGLRTASVVVTGPGGSSDPRVMNIAPASPGVFTQNGSGYGQAVGFNVRSDGSFSLNTAQNSIDPGSDWGMMILGTGLGAVLDRANGMGWTYRPVPGAPVGVVLRSGPASGAFHALGVRYAGPAPARGGIDQINAQLTDADRTGPPDSCTVPMTVSYRDVAIPQVLWVSVQRGGGACGQSSHGLGQITWSREVISDVKTSSSESVVGQFVAGGNVQFPFVFQGTTSPAPPIPTFSASGGTPIDIGEIILTPPGSLPVSVNAASE